MHESEKWKWSCSVVSDSSGSHGLQSTRLLHPWDFPGKSTAVGCHCLLRSHNSIWTNKPLQVECVLQHWWKNCWRARKSKQMERTPREIETLPSDDITSIWTENHMPGLVLYWPAGRRCTESVISLASLQLGNFSLANLPLSVTEVTGLFTCTTFILTIQCTTHVQSIFNMTS